MASDLASSWMLLDLVIQICMSEFGRGWTRAGGVAGPRGEARLGPLHPLALALVICYVDANVQGVGFHDLVKNVCGL